MKTKLHNKIVSVLLALITVITTCIGSGSTVFASELVLNEKAGYSYTGVSPHLGYAITHDNIYVMKVDGKKYSV